MKKKYLYIILSLIVATFIIYKIYNKEHVNTTTVASDVIIEPKELLNAFQLDEESANKKYLDKIIEIKGMVKAVNNLDKGGNIVLETGDDMSSVICEFENGSKISDIKVSSIVTIKGICTGILSDIVLTRCSIKKS